MNVFWFILTHGDGLYLSTSIGGKAITQTDYTGELEKIHIFTPIYGDHVLRGSYELAAEVFGLGNKQAVAQPAAYVNGHHQPHNPVLATLAAV